MYCSLGIDKSIQAVKHSGIFLLGLLYTSTKLLQKETNSYMVSCYAIFTNLWLTL